MQERTHAKSRVRHARMHSYTHTRTHAHTHALTHQRTPPPPPPHTHSHAHAHKHKYTHIHVHARAHTHTHTHSDTHEHVHERTQARSWARFSRPVTTKYVCDLWYREDELRTSVYADFLFSFLYDTFQQRSSCIPYRVTLW
jgi:hypothetical protein